MGRNLATTIDPFLGNWQASAQSAAATLSTADGRWAMVSTFVTAAVAGSIALLAAGTARPTHDFDGVRGRTSMPYELFQRLLQQSRGMDYADVAPMPGIGMAPSRLANPPQALDRALAVDNDDDADNGNSGVDKRDISLDSGDTLARVLNDAGATPQDAEAAVIALSKVYDPRAVKAGMTLHVSFASVPQPEPVAQIIYTPPSGSDGMGGDVAAIQPEPAAPVGRLLSVSFSPTIDHDVTIARTAAGGFTAQDEHKQLVAHFHHAGARIDSSLYLAAMQGGIPAEVVVQMIHMFSYEVDFQRDIHPGDSFEVYYNYYYTPDGKPAKQGDISFAAMHFPGRTVSLYRYQPKGEDTPDFFDASGKSARNMLMKTPVDGARISSGFGMRFHPVLGYTRMHKGIDFAVPSGTPVMAAGAGTVKMEGWLGGYGNFVLVDHGNTYQTAYGHLSRFAPGIHQGSHVRQGQVIAYSGATGLATGPHLHYEIRVNGTQVNPAQVKVAGGRILSGADMRDFQFNRLHTDSQLASMPLEGKVADSTGDLRAAKD